MSQRHFRAQLSTHRHAVGWKYQQAGNPPCPPLMLMDWPVNYRFNAAGVRAVHPGILPAVSSAHHQLGLVTAAADLGLLTGAFFLVF
ncbi:hypothetical protein HUM63_005146 [Escherichia coli]|nr:hypothetical protein [Escherichia coli]